MTGLAESTIYADQEVLPVLPIARLGHTQTGNAVKCWKPLAMILSELHPGVGWRIGYVAQGVACARNLARRAVVSSEAVRMSGTNGFPVLRSRPRRRCELPLAEASSEKREIPSPPDELRNEYYAIRHGQSTANVVNIISSDPIVGSTMHELTPLGGQQAVGAGQTLWDMLLANSNDDDELSKVTLGDADILDKVALYSSNFTRARETKEIVAFELQRSWARDRGGALSDSDSDGDGRESPMVRIGLLSGLRERNFGKLNGVNTGAYDNVWPRDLVDPWHETDGVESIASVCARLRAMIDVLEARHNGDCIVLCGHADVLQIFQCWMACDTNVCDFSSYRFKNGEVRYCDPYGECLPDKVPMVSQSGSAA